MLSIFKAIFGEGLPAQIRKAYEAKLNAQNDSERIAAEVELAKLDSRLKSQLIGGKWITLIQILWAAPFVIYNAKLVVWDKVLKLGVTDPLSPELYSLQMMIAGFFFLTTVFKGITR
jgi:hypothetical protein